MSGVTVGVLLITFFKGDRCVYVFSVLLSSGQNSRSQSVAAHMSGALATSLVLVRAARLIKGQVF